MFFSACTTAADVDGEDRRFNHSTLRDCASILSGVPMSKYAEYRASRTSWGLNVLGSFCVKIEASDGTTRLATGFGGPPACWIAANHLERFLIGVNPRNLNRLSDQTFRSTMFSGGKGLPVATISDVDLALWDLIGKIRGEPVYKMIDGAIKDELDFYCTAPSGRRQRRLASGARRSPTRMVPTRCSSPPSAEPAHMAPVEDSVASTPPLIAAKAIDLNLNKKNILHSKHVRTVSSRGAALAPETPLEVRLFHPLYII